MNAFDLIILAILILLTLRGVMKGMVSQIVSIGSYIVCWIVASRFAFVIAPSIPAEEPWNQIGAMIVLFVVTMIAIRFAHSVLEKWIKDWHLQKLNRFFGGALGFLKGILICMVLTFFAVMLSETTRKVVFESKSGIPLSELIEKSGAFIPRESCELLREQIDRFAAKVEGRSIDSLQETASTEGGFFSGLFSTSGTSDASDGSESARSEGITGLFARGNALLEEAKSFQNDLSRETEGAVSLLDGISRWWNGTKKENLPEETQSQATVDEVRSAAENLLPKVEFSGNPSPVSNATASASATSASTTLSTPLSASLPASLPTSLPAPSSSEAVPQIARPVPDSSAYREETLLRRRDTTADSSAPSTLSSLSSGTTTEADRDAAVPAMSNVTTVPSVHVGSRAMSIPRSSAPFRLSRLGSNPMLSSSERLLDSTTKTTTAPQTAPATLFSPRQAGSIR